MNNVLLQILKKKGLTFEQLTHEERETFISWQKILEGEAPDIRQFLTLLDNEANKVSSALQKLQIKENALFNGPSTEQVYLAARLENLIVLASFIRNPLEARERLEESLARQFKLA